MKFLISPGWTVAMLLFVASAVLVYIFRARLQAKQGLVEGPIVGSLLKFSMPLLVGNIFQQFYNVVDIIVVGKYIGSNAVAVVGQAGQIYFFLVALTIGLTMGIGILVAQSFGAKRWERLTAIIDTGYIFTVGAGLLVTAAGLIFTPWILKALRTPEAIVDSSAVFLRIMFLGTLFNFGYNAVSSVLRGVGDSITPLIFLIIAAAVNIFLDLFFIVHLELGVESAAWATIIAQAVACLSVVFYSRGLSERYLRVRPLHMSFNASAFLHIMKVGLPSGIQQSLISLSLLVLMRMVNNYGAAAAAAYGAIPRLDAFVILPSMTFGVAITTFVGQNLGAGKIERLRSGLRTVNNMTLLISAFISLVILVPFRYQLLSLFIPAGDTEVLEIGASFFWHVGWFYPLIGLMFIYSGAIRGLGRTMSSLILTIISLIGIRMPVAWLLSHKMGITGIWLAFPISWAGGWLLNYFYWRATDLKALAAKVYKES
jgi:putative MATE family efflux protein